MSKSFATIEQAIAALKQGQMIIVVDDEQRENEGDLVIAADKVTPESINFMAKYGRGLICLALTEQRFKQLDIPMQLSKNSLPNQSAFGVSIDAASGVTTGISAHDRAHTIKLAADYNYNADAITMPGHIMPLKAKNGGVLKRAGHTEASVDLAQLAGLKPAGVICEIMNDDGSMARLGDLEKFAEQHNLLIISIADLIDYRITTEQLVTQVAAATLPIRKLGEFDIKVFESEVDGKEHVALIKGEIAADKPCLVRLHSECLTGDIFASARCDCGSQLQQALAMISEQGGIMLYLRQEGRGIGLANKIKAYALQEKGMDTVEANHALGFAADLREFRVANQILRSLGAQKIILMTNNPNKIKRIAGNGVEVVKRIPVHVEPEPHNVKYLRTKQEKLGHLLELNIGGK